MIAAFSMGLVMFALKELLMTFDAGKIGFEVAFGSMTMLFVLSLISVFFLLLAPEMASVIMGSQSGSALPGIVGGIISGGVVWGGKEISKEAGSAVGYGARKVGGALYNAGPKQAVESVKSYVKNRFSQNYKEQKPPGGEK
jgi:hypothetical protein